MHTGYGGHQGVDTGMSQTECDDMSVKNPPEEIQDAGESSLMTDDLLLQEIKEAIMTEEEANAGGSQNAPTAAAQPAGGPSGRWGNASPQTAAESVHDRGANPLDEKLALVLKEITEAIAEDCK